MKVKDLIEILFHLPEEADVYVPSQTGGWYKPSDAQVEEDQEHIVKIS